MAKKTTVLKKRKAWGITSNPFLNFCLSLCVKKSDEKAADLAINAGREWRKMNDDQKKAFYILAGEAKSNRSRINKKRSSAVPKMIYERKRNRERKQSSSKTKNEVDKTSDDQNGDKKPNADATVTDAKDKSKTPHSSPRTREDRNRTIGQSRKRSISSSWDESSD